MEGPIMKCILIVVATLVWCSSIATAQVGAPGPCAADIQSHCLGVQPGEGRIRACVEAHVNDLSDVCKTRLARVEAADKACADDVKQNCGGVKPGRGRIIACLRKALGNLSDACKTLLPQADAGQ
jgi:hypothetical protein